MTVKGKYNFRLTDEAKSLLESIATTLGVSQTAVLEITIREKAAAMNITSKDPASTPPEK